MKVKEEIERQMTELKSIRDRIKWLRSHKAELEKLPAGRMCGDTLDFDRLPHADVIKVVRTLGGKWHKSENKHADSSRTTIDYESDVSGRRVRCWGGEPPPSCRIVEVEEDVPEQVIPAHKRKVKKMICTGQEPVAVAIAQAMVPLVNKNAESKGQ